MKLAKRRVFGACIVSAALLVSGCARSGPVSDVTKRGPCPSTYPTTSRQFSLRSVNDGVRGLGARLVPFPAQQVRVCSYGSGGRALLGSAVLKQDAAARLEAATNRLERKTSSPAKFACPEFDTSLLTFTTATEGMAVAVADCGRGVASNGTLTVDSTRAWLNEISAYTAPRPAPA